MLNKVKHIYCFYFVRFKEQQLVIYVLMWFMLQLLEPGEPLIPGKIRDSNRTTLLAQLRDHNYSCVDLGIAKDT